MRQDALVLQLVKMMNDIWLSQELDLRMVIFRCMPFGNKSGMSFRFVPCLENCGFVPFHFSFFFLQLIKEVSSCV